MVAVFLVNQNLSNTVHHREFYFGRIMMSHHKIEVKDLYYSYPDGHQAVKGMSFIIGHGESVGIVGANGAGKSTLIMLLMGLVFPSGGTVIIGDAEVTKKNVAPYTAEDGACLSGSG